MSKMNAIKTFRDLLAFLTIIQLGKTDDFVVTSVKAMFPFPLIGGFIGLLAAASKGNIEDGDIVTLNRRIYRLTGCCLLCMPQFPNRGYLAFINSLIHIPAEFLLNFLAAIMTPTFLLILTGLQHFDGPVDSVNAIGIGNIKEEQRHMYGT